MKGSLFVVPDETNYPPKRYMVEDKVGNVLFITSISDESPEETAVMWAMRRGGWLTGLVEGGKIPLNLDKIVLRHGYRTDEPLYVVLDRYERRLLVQDDEGNVLFLTSLDEEEPEQSATLAAMQLGGWLKGVVEKMRE